MLILSTSISKVKVRLKVNGHIGAKNVAKVVGATSSEGFLAFVRSLRAALRPYSGPVHLPRERKGIGRCVRCMLATMG